MIVYPHLGIAFPSIVLPTPDIDLSRWSVVACDQHSTNDEYWNEVASLVGATPSTLNYIIPEVLGSVGADEIAKRWHAMKRAVDDRLLVQYHNLSIVTERRFIDNTVRYGCMIAIDLERYNFASDAQSPDTQSIDCVVPTEETFPDKVRVRVAIRQQAVLEFPHILVLYDNPHTSWRQQLQALISNATRLYRASLMKDGGTVTGYAVTAPHELHSLTNIISNTTSRFNPSSLTTSSFKSRRHAVYSDNTAPSQISYRGTPILYVGDGNHALASAKQIWSSYKQTDTAHNANVHTQFHPLRYALVEAVNIHDSGLKFLPIHQVLIGNTQQWLQDIIGAICSLGTKYRFDDSKQLALLHTQHPTSAILQIYRPSEQFVIVCSAQLPVVAIAEVIEPQLVHGGSRLFVHEWEDAIQLCKQRRAVALRMPTLDRARVLEHIAQRGRLPKKSFSLGHSEEKRYYLEGRFLIDNDYPSIGT